MNQSQALLQLAQLWEAAGRPFGKIRPQRAKAWTIIPADTSQMVGFAAINLLGKAKIFLETLKLLEMHGRLVLLPHLSYCPLGYLLQPHWPLGCSLNTPAKFLPQGLCTCCSLCLECSS